MKEAFLSPISLIFKNFLKWDQYMNEKEKIIHADFFQMLALAEKYFDTSSCGNSEYHQCLVLKTEQGYKIYSFACDAVKELVGQCCDMLTTEKINVVEKIVCMWEGGAIDVPAHQFVIALCELNDENKNAQIFLSAGNGSYTIKRLSDVIK